MIAPFPPTAPPAPEPVAEAVQSFVALAIPLLILITVSALAAIVWLKRYIKEPAKPKELNSDQILLKNKSRKKILNEVLPHLTPSEKFEYRRLIVLEKNLTGGTETTARLDELEQLVQLRLLQEETA